MVDVQHHRSRRLARQHLLEMPRRQRVLALQEEGLGELQAGTDQTGLPDQHPAQGGDGGVQKRVPRLLGNTGLL